MLPALPAGSDAGVGRATTRPRLTPVHTGRMSTQRSSSLGALSPNAVFAVVLARMVRDRCKSEKRGTTLRTGLQATVPVNERPYVRRGLDALIEHGVLALSGENIGLTRAGLMLLETATNPQSAGAEEESMRALHLALDAEERLVPLRSMDEILTLHGRLEGATQQRAGPSSRRSTLVLLLLLLVVAAAVALYLSRR